jgi:hypothetical protein
MHHTIVPGGIFSWANGYMPDAKARILRERQHALVAEAKRDPEGCFDRLWQECRYAEASWLIEHLEKLEE